MTEEAQAQNQEQAQAETTEGAASLLDHLTVYDGQQHDLSAHRRRQAGSSAGIYRPGSCVADRSGHRPAFHGNEADRDRVGTGEIPTPGDRGKR